MIVTIFFDFEVFLRDWLVVCIDPIKQKEHVIVNDKDKLLALYNEYRNDIWVGYNCRNYDQYILKAILLGFDPKQVNDWIIVKKRKGWQYSTMFNKIKVNIYDVMPNPPVSLKTLEGFMGYNIHETSVPFDTPRRLSRKELEETIEYCRYDVMNTIEVFLRRKGEFDAQMDLIKAFNLPLSHIGKTQAQLAAVILDAKRVRFDDDWDIRLPETADLGKYSEVGNWFLDKANHKEKCSLEIMIAGMLHTIAWGGIHGGLPKTVVTCDDDEIIYDVDAGQLYPNIMRHYKLLSRGARKPEMLDFVLDTSMRLKAEGKKKEREPYKRQCNIFYGAEGDPDNPLYDPLHRALVCVFGQVFLIDLIDKIEDIVTLINSNTDGIFFKIKKKDIPELERRVKEWEERTHLRMEYDSYVKYIGKDVNNYIAITGDGKLHAKGGYVKDQNDLDYDLPIVNEALRNYMVFGTPVETTINACTDFRKFQKIVKLSAKFEWVEHEQGWNPWYGKRGKLNVRYDRGVKFDNKAYRVFASTDVNDGRLMKCKTLEDGKIKKDKFGVTPEHCFIVNSDIRGMEIPKKLDRNYYIELAKTRLEHYGL